MFVEGVDYTGFSPIDAVISDSIFGAMIGNSQRVLGWFRDHEYRGPDWTLRQLSKQRVAFAIRGPDTPWRLEIVDTATGKSRESRLVAAKDGRVEFVFPNFSGSIAVKLAREKSPRRSAP